MRVTCWYHFLPIFSCFLHLGVLALYTLRKGKKGKNDDESTIIPRKKERHNSDAGSVDLPIECLCTCTFARMVYMFTSHVGPHVRFVKVCRPYSPLNMFPVCPIFSLCSFVPVSSRSLSFIGLVCDLLPGGCFDLEGQPKAHCQKSISVTVTILTSTAWKTPVP